MIPILRLLGDDLVGLRLGPAAHSDGAALDASWWSEDVPADAPGTEVGWCPDYEEIE